MNALDTSLSESPECANVAKLPQIRRAPPVSREAGLARLRAEFERLTDAQFRDALEIVADEAKRRTAARLLADVAEERRLESLSGPVLAQIVGQYPGGVA